MNILITCPFGLSALLAKELKRLQITPVKTLDTAILATTDWKGIYTINLRSRLANKCYLILGESRITTFDQLFDFVGKLPRGEYLASSNLSIQVVSKHSQLSAEKSIQSVGHKAILNALTPTITSPKTENTPISTVLFYLDHDQLKVCLNTSGASLHQRGWRNQTWPAPLKENLAAAMVLLSGWKFTAPLRDPFCGSGTIVIEAAMLAKNIAPGIKRTFAFQQFRNYDSVLRTTLLEEAKAKEFQGEYQLFGSDIDTQVLAYAKENAERAGVAEYISWKEADFSIVDNSFPMLPKKGTSLIPTVPSWLLTNPPYGKRLNANENLTPLYHHLATLLQQKETFGGVISSFPWIHQLFPPSWFSHKSLYTGADQVEFYYKKPL